MKWWRLALGVAKWVFTGLAAIVVSVLVWSCFMRAALSRIVPPDYVRIVVLCGGCVEVREVWMRPAFTLPLPPPWSMSRHNLPMEWWFKYEVSDPIGSKPPPKPLPWDAPRYQDPLIAPLYPVPSRQGTATHPSVSSRIIRIPLWTVAAVLLLCSGPLWFFAARARRREMAGRCPKCGYSRRGLAADAKCPECGTPAAPAPE